MQNLQQFAQNQEHYPKKPAKPLKIQHPAQLIPRRNPGGGSWYQVNRQRSGTRAAAGTGSSDPDTRHPAQLQRQLGSDRGGRAAGRAFLFTGEPGTGTRRDPGGGTGSDPEPGTPRSWYPLQLIPGTRAAPGAIRIPGQEPQRKDGQTMGKQMERKAATELIKSSWKQLYPADKGKGSRQGIICPICGSGSGKNGTGITEKPGSKHFLKCWRY